MGGRAVAEKTLNTGAKIARYESFVPSSEFGKRPPAMLGNRVSFQLIESSGVKLEMGDARTKPAFPEFAHDAVEGTNNGAAPDFRTDVDAAQARLLEKLASCGLFGGFPWLGATARREPERKTIVAEGAKEENAICEIEQQHASGGTDGNASGGGFVPVSHVVGAWVNVKKYAPSGRSHWGTYQPMCSVDHVTGILPLSTLRFLRFALLRLTLILRLRRCP